PWRKALLFPGAEQMRHLRTLIESRPMLARIPDQSLIVGDAGKGTERIEAARAKDGSCAMVYSSSGRPFRVDLGKLAGSKVQAWWFDPRTGTARKADVFPRQGAREFHPPARGKAQDWVLVLDDASRSAPPPGMVKP
ncbi:MAG: putative collagen-binding domain-containing protein, partial [Isosphaeraceae bacterium]